MPSKSPEQAWFMERACKDEEFARRNKIDQAVACEFYEADQKLKKEKEEAEKKKKEPTSGKPAPTPRKKP